MGEILGTLCISLAVAAYAASARALGRELLELSRRTAESQASVQDDRPDAELTARDLHLRHALQQLEDVGAVDFGGIDGLGG